MEISNPRRLLFLGAPDAGVLTLLNDLTGSAPPLPPSSSTAGLSHTWPLTTAYYTATLPIWIDEITNLSDWRTEFTKPEASEVVQALGAWVYCFRKPVTQAEFDTIMATMEAIQEVIEEGGGHSWDGVCLAVAMSQGMTPQVEKSGEEWEDVCRACGVEYVDAEAQGRNEFGEVVGVARIKEALEANEWEGDEGGAADLHEVDEDYLGAADGLGMEEAEIEREFLNMKTALHLGNGSPDESDKDDEEAQVEEVERMMLRLQAVRDMSADMPETQKRKLAARTVNDIMRNM